MKAQKYWTYRKIPKISRGAYIFWKPFLRGLSTERNFRFKICWASLIVGSKFTVLLCCTFDLRAIFQVQAPGGLYLEGRFNGGFFLCYRVGGLIFGGAYSWRGLFSEFYGMYDINGLPDLASDCSPLFVEPMFLFGWVLRNTSTYCIITFWLSCVNYALRGEFPLLHRLLQDIFTYALFWLTTVNLSLKTSFPIILFRLFETNFLSEPKFLCDECSVNLYFFFGQGNK